MLALGYGLTNIVARPTREAAEISKAEYAEGTKQLDRKVERQGHFGQIRLLRPKAVCFVGKGVYQQFSNRKTVSWGVQKEPVIPGIVEYVAPSSSGLVRMKLADIVEIYSGLNRYI